MWVLVVSQLFSLSGLSLFFPFPVVQILIWDRLKSGPGSVVLSGMRAQDMDRDVLRVGRELALCTLDVQLDALYLTLEEEVRLILDVEADTEITGMEPAAELAQVLTNHWHIASIVPFRWFVANWTHRF